MASQIIWYNSNILINNKPFVLPTVADSGLLRVAQLFTNDGRPKTFDEMSQDFVITRYQHIQLWYSIPLNWKRVLATQGISNDPMYINFNRLINEHKISAIVYDKVITSEDVLINRKHRWERKFDRCITNKEFPECS